METEIEKKINDNFLCILKFSPNSKMVLIDYEPILKPLEKDFEELKKKFDSDDNVAKNILEYIKGHIKLKVLLERYNYCERLADSFQGLYLSVSEMTEKYKSDFPDNEARKGLLQREKNTLLLDLQERLQAYYLEESYKTCERKRLQKAVLAYSHRRVGWSTPKYILNDNFSIEIKTNFGYGYASYFYTRLSYKNVDIIAFSDWIVYESVHS